MGPSMASSDHTPPGGGPPPFPDGPYPVIFRCVLTAVSPTGVYELADIFARHGLTVLADGAAAFSVRTSADQKYLQIEEVS